MTLTVSESVVRELVIKVFVAAHSAYAQPDECSAPERRHESYVVRVALVGCGYFFEKEN